MLSVSAYTSYLLICLSHFLKQSGEPLKRGDNHFKKEMKVFQWSSHLIKEVGSERNGRYCTFALLLFNLLRCSQLVKRSLIGQKYNHAANMNSESAKELLKWQNSALVCTLGKRKGM